MRLFSVVRTSRQCVVVALGLVVALAVICPSPIASTAASAQTIDCGRLQQQIAQAPRGGGNRYAVAARRQAVELARTQAYAQQLGCGGFSSFFGGNPQCGGLNQRIQQMQANLGQLQAASGGDGGGQRADLVARFNAYCRGAPAPQQPRGFFESIFGGGQQQPAPPLPDMRQDQQPADEDGAGHARGGSQAVCVRTCDGGFFPLGVSARRGRRQPQRDVYRAVPGHRGGRVHAQP